MMGRAMERGEMMREDEFEGEMNQHQKKMDIAKLLMEMENAKAKNQIEKQKISASNRRPRNPKAE